MDSDLESWLLEMSLLRESLGGGGEWVETDPETLVDGMLTLVVGVVLEQCVHKTLMNSIVNHGDSIQIGEKNKKKEKKLLLLHSSLASSRNTRAIH